MTSLQGRAKGVMECWYTSAERQPGERGKMVSIGSVLPDERIVCTCWVNTMILLQNH